MKFQNPTIKFFLKGRTDAQTSQTNMLPTFSKFGALICKKYHKVKHLAHIKTTNM